MNSRFVRGYENTAHWVYPTSVERGNLCLDDLHYERIMKSVCRGPLRSQGDDVPVQNSMLLVHSLRRKSVRTHRSAKCMA